VTPTASNRSLKIKVICQGFYYESFPLTDCVPIKN